MHSLKGAVKISDLLHELSAPDLTSIHTDKISIAPSQSEESMRLVHQMVLLHKLPNSVCLLQDASGHSNVLKAGKAEELKNARKRRTARQAN